MTDAQDSGQAHDRLSNLSPVIAILQCSLRLRNVTPSLPGVRFECVSGGDGRRRGGFFCKGSG